MKQFSKKLLVLDYMFTAILIIAMFVCIAINGVYVSSVTNTYVEMGLDVSTIIAPLNIDVFNIILSAWIAQLGISSGAYYMMAKSDHRIELPMILVNQMPDELKEQCDMTQIITTVLNTSDN